VPGRAGDRAAETSVGWNERRGREYAEEFTRRGLVAVPEGWRGADGAHRILLVTTVPAAPEQLRAAHDHARRLAVLGVVPTLAQNERRFRLGDATEAVEHAEAVARRTVAALRDAGIAVAGHIGPADPAVALSDGLRSYHAEGVVVIRNQPGAHATSRTCHCRRPQLPMTEVAGERPAD
jgi:hypothetical protein